MYIKLVTEIPHPEDEKFVKKLEQYETRSMHGQLPIVWDSAEGFIVKDRHGNEFLDFTSTIAVTNTGHGNQYVRMALGNLLNKPLMHTYTFPNEPRLGFLKNLVNTCYPGGKAFLVSAGTEATEVAIKLMRMHGQKADSNKRRIISFKGAMHGRTSIAEQLKGINGDNLWAYTFDDGIKSIEMETKLHILEEQKRHICGIIVESYQGWSASFHPKQYIQDLVKWARENNILVCFDEIQSGCGRTGKMWAWEHYEIDRPDLICFGKGISGSLPLSGVLGRADILDIPEVGSMSSTHSANPLSCVAGLVNLWRLKEDNLIEESRRKGLILEKELKDIKYKVNCKGLVAAIITNTEEEATNIVWECFKKGLLLIWTHKNSVKIAPPLTIKDDALLEGLEIIKEVIK